MNFGWFIWTIYYCWLFGPEKLDDYMGLYFASMMKYLLGYYWVIFGLVLCLAFNRQYLIRLAGSHMCWAKMFYVVLVCFNYSDFCMGWPYDSYSPSSLLVY
jgi:hypothetical protein